MPRPRRDGLPSHAPRKHKLTDSYVRSLQVAAQPYLVWDTKVAGLAVAVYPTGSKSWKVIYPFNRRTRWYSIGKVSAIDADNARSLAVPVLLAVASGTDPQAQRKADRAGTFEELHALYLERHAKKTNKSWSQADALIRRHLTPRWAKLSAAQINRSDVKTALARIEKGSVALQTLRAAGAVFSWGIKEEVMGLVSNPCQRIDMDEGKARERVLSHGEIPQFWKAFDAAGLVASTALKVLLLLGQRPGEVRRMRFEHIRDGWWELPGQPVPELKWPGTKNGASHRVWLPHAVQKLIAELTDGDGTGWVFANAFGNAIANLDEAMRDICTKLKIERATPHDLRRTHGTTITGLGFGRDAMNRIQNHKEGGIADVYDRHHYESENKHIMETVANHILQLVEGKATDRNVIAGKFR